MGQASHKKIMFYFVMREFCSYTFLEIDMTRMLALINSCGKCDRCKCNSGGIYTCDMVNQPIRDKTRIADFCPLPTYPDREIASLEATVKLLRVPNEHGFRHAIMAFIADKLKATISLNGEHITILIGKEKTPLLLFRDAITEFDLDSSMVIFVASTSPGEVQKKYAVKSRVTGTLVLEEILTSGESWGTWNPILHSTT